jgi:hypothetical protein
MKFEPHRERLAFVFRSRGCANPEKLAHLTLELLAQRVEQGVSLAPHELPGYLLGLAERVARDARRRTAWTYAQSVVLAGGQS